MIEMSNDSTECKLSENMRWCCPKGRELLNILPTKVHCALRHDFCQFQIWNTKSKTPIVCSKTIAIIVGVAELKKSRFRACPAFITLKWLLLKLIVLLQFHCTSQTKIVSLLGKFQLLNLLPFIEKEWAPAILR
jgi:hypothetical protein